MIRWIIEHIKLSAILTPIATRNIIHRDTDTYVGYTDLFIFGIRLSRIQRTMPWNKDR